MILIISTCHEKLSEEEFVMPIAEIVKSAGKDITIKHYKEAKLAETNKAEKIIICGTALQDNEYLKQLDKFSWLKKAKKPVLGICSGMQILALQNSAKLTENQEIGRTKIRVKKANILFQKDFDAYELHANGLENLKEFEILAESYSGTQAIKLKSKEQYGIMFHPEVRNENIVRNFLSLT